MQAQGLVVTPDTLRIAENAVLILPLHGALDRAREAARGEARIGTTGRGIGPAYEDKVARRAIRACDLAEPETLSAKLDELLLHHNTLLRGWVRRLSRKPRCWMGCSRWRRACCRSSSRYGSGWTCCGRPANASCSKGRRR